MTNKTGAELTQLGFGDVIGEIGLIDDQPASADVTATRPSLVLQLPISDVRSVLLDSPRGALGVATILAARLRKANTRKMVRSPKVIAVHGAAGSAALLDTLVNAVPGARSASTVDEVWDLEPDHLVIVDAANRSVTADLELVVRDDSTADVPAVAPRCS